MGVITDISPQAKNKERVNVYIDGAFFCGLDAFTVLERRLKIGAEISEEGLAGIVMDGEKRSALDRATKRLGYSLMPEKEMKAYLFERGYLAQAVEYAVEKLKEYGYIGDSGYVRAYYNDNSSSRGDKGIRYELERKGIDENILEDFFADSDDTNRCRAVAEKYMRGKALDQKNKAALSRHLYSRGFAWETAGRVIEEIFRE